jgi:putative transposase
MRLTIQLQLLPGDDASLLLNTMEAFNAAAQHAAQVGYEARLASQPGIHQRCYYDLRKKYGLSAQMAVRAIGKAVEVLRRDKTKLPQFKPHGAITYDERILSWKGLNHVSLWTLEGRKVLPYVFGEYQAKRLDRLKGQVDLIYRDGKFFLYATGEFSEDPPIEASEFLGVDLGIANLATDSDGNIHTGEQVEAVRQKHARVRRSLGKKMGGKRQTRRGARRAMKRIGKRESRFRCHTNHCISKSLVAKAKDTGRGISLENLKGIRGRTRFRKSQRAKMAGWAFAQLRQFIDYKAKLFGVPVVLVNARNTSRTCSECGHCEKANRQSQEQFLCRACGHLANADVNAARNIAQLGRPVNPPEASESHQLAFAAG